MSDGQPIAYEAPPERYPFWSYGDLALFLGLSAPALLAGAVLVRIVIRALHLNVHSKAVELLPAQYVGIGFLFLFLCWVFKVQYRRPFWASLRWVRAPVSFTAAILFGCLLAFAVATIGALLKTPDIDTPMKELLSDWTSILLVALFAITLGPLCEELVFRGFMQPLLVRTAGPAAGIVLTAIPFGLLHLPQYAFSWRHGLLVTLASVGFGWMRQISGSTRASAIMHAAYNATFFVGYLGQGRGLPTTW
jgi:membrane protease YdiL (CAAX protease family)